jgi:hypothetical protein
VWTCTLQNKDTLFRIQEAAAAIAASLFASLYIFQKQISPDSSSGNIPISDTIIEKLLLPVRMLQLFFSFSVDYILLYGILDFGRGVAEDSVLLGCDIRIRTSASATRSHSSTYAI